MELAFDRVRLPKREAIASKMLAQQSLDAAEAKALESEAQLAGQEAQYAKQIEEFPQKVVDEFMTQAAELGNSRPQLASVAQARLQNLDMSLPHERDAAVLLMQAYMSATKPGSTRLAPLSTFRALLARGRSPAQIIDYMENNYSNPPPLPPLPVEPKPLPENAAQQAAQDIGLGYTEEQIQEILDQTSV